MHCKKNFEASLYNNLVYESSTLSENEVASESVEHIQGNSLLCDQLKKHEESGYGQLLAEPGKYFAGVELLDILRKAKVPLYLFDQIIEWTQRASIHYNIKFDECLYTREKMIEIIENRFGMKGLHPITEKIFLPGCQSNVTLVYHDFKQCLYSILTDAELMKDENLLLGPNNELQYQLHATSDILNDVSTGSCFRAAYKSYITNPRDLLCPIIFFIDKTHTDIQGRLCLEPLQFTLGIFNRTVRSHPKSWRTLGYVNDLQKRYSGKGKEKLQDYHLMLKVLLRSFSESQKEPILWEIKPNGVSKFVRLKIPVMFVIGDTEGHDKLCGRYSCRVNSPSLCRYCNIPFNSTDDPFFTIRHRKVQMVKDLIARNKVQRLKLMSMHCIKNAWHDIDFCDKERGIHGATLAEVLHCIQQGIIEYSINTLFEQKKQKKLRGKQKRELVAAKKRKRNDEADIEESDIEESSIEETEEEEIDESNDEGEESESDSDDARSEIDERDDFSETTEETTENSSIETERSSLSTNSTEISKDPYLVESKYFSFSQAYLDFFDKLCRRYGRHLQHQSDRDLPRTLFSGNYVTVAKKNAHEVAGIILVYLFVFSSTEGESKLTKTLGADRRTSFIHGFELLLMLENFCKQHMHTAKDLKIAKKGIPLVMNTIKILLNRRQGHGMKIIKFHLMLHFAEDILRFGSMRNFDSCIGERHHTTEVKDPARKTQRRKGVFELQTAKRYVENIGIQRANREIPEVHKKPTDVDDSNVNKRNNILYDYDKQMFMKMNWTKKKYEPCVWKDTLLMKNLKETCNELIEAKKIDHPVRFFTQHNRNKTIFRADPNFNDKGPWYDWVNVDWDMREPLPAKMLIFVDLTETFRERFQVGTSYVTEPGCYAVSHSFGCTPIQNISLLVDYGKVITNADNTPQLCLFNVNAIFSVCVAVPFKTTDTIITGIKWLLLKPRNEWYSMFIDHLSANVKKKD